MNLPKKVLVLFYLLISICSLFKPLAAIAEQTCLRANFGNINCDFSGLINEDDVLLQLTDWLALSPRSDLSGDSNRIDQKVNTFDYTTIAKYWGIGSPQSSPNLTFDSEFPWSQAEKDKIASILNQYHTMILSIYGLPYKTTPLNMLRSSNTTPCSRTPCFYDYEIYFGFQPYGDVLEQIESTKSILLHEYLHSFHADQTMFSEFEEPMAVAAGHLILPPDNTYSDWLNYQTYEYLKENSVLQYGHGVFGGVIHIYQQLNY